MATFAKLFGIALPVFLVIDLIWLGVLARPFYQAQLGPLMKEDVDWGAAIIFYLIFVAGIVVLAVLPAVEKESFLRAVALGAMLGLVSYAAFDLTGLATLTGFPRTMAIVDLIWGTVLTATVSAVTYKIWFLFT
jgi:uncharacterized membrane protein